ncbi:dienelactone hydrolase family protein [Streptomyces sp. NPDC049597]|uniref:dienelactone hydrolase family protein n=1 Tax=Streptomyces sp. NPDC049597 TaxID=3155276 RepID=UPI003440BC4D
MTDVVLFHHAQGLTPGVLGFAEELRGAGHTVHAPDLYDGHTFGTLKAGLAHLSEIGVEEILTRGTRAVAELPAAVVFVGFSLGVVSAQKLAQTRPGARGAVLVSACVPTSYFGPWPAGVPARVHAMEADPVFRDEGDAEAARALVDEVPDAELHLYPGEQHNFADSSLSSYDAQAAALLLQRTLAFLDGR